MITAALYYLIGNTRKGVVFADWGFSHTQEIKRTFCCGDGIAHGLVFQNSENNEHYHTFIDYLSRFPPVIYKPLRKF